MRWRYVFQVQPPTVERQPDLERISHRGEAHLEVSLGDAEYRQTIILKPGEEFYIDQGGEP